MIFVRFDMKDDPKCINMYEHQSCKIRKRRRKVQTCVKALAYFLLYTRQRDQEKSSQHRLKFVLLMSLSKRCLELLTRRSTWPTAALRCARQNSRSITTGRLGSLPRTPLFEAIKSHDPESSAVVHALSGRQFSYASLLKDVAIAKQRLANDAGRDAEALQGERIAFLVENSYDYVGALCSHFLVSLSHCFCTLSLPYLLLFDLSGMHLLRYVVKQ